MRRAVILAVMLLLASGSAHAGPKEEADAVFARFLAAFTAADPAGAADQFWPDALFWGTGMTTLATTQEAVRGYFAPVGRNRPDEWRASALSTDSVVLSEGAVMLSGLWQVETGSPGSVERRPLRVSMVVTQRGGVWKIAQFHNSAMPAR